MCYREALTISLSLSDQREKKRKERERQPRHSHPVRHHQQTKTPQRDEAASQAASQPASHHLNRLLKETHTERTEANAYFWSTGKQHQKKHFQHKCTHAYSPLCWCRGIVNGKRRRERESEGKKKKCIGDERFGVVHGEMHALGQVGRCNVFVLKGKPCAIRRRNIALLAVGSFTTGSSRFASYVTNGLSGVGKERGICWMREREKSSTALNSHGNLHLG